MASASAAPADPILGDLGLLYFNHPRDGQLTRWLAGPLARWLGGGWRLAGWLAVWLAANDWGRQVLEA